MEGLGRTDVGYVGRADVGRMALYTSIFFKEIQYKTRHRATSLHGKTSIRWVTCDVQTYLSDASVMWINSGEIQFEADGRTETRKAK